ncbi:MAG: hypothetical protein IPM24_27350 [Bryobacterales bacterium]|nr:hypothetical protein [Bryobacterales bacterium]
MAVIRKEQMGVFEEAALAGFERRLQEHVREAFPKHSGMLGEEGVARVVKCAMENARSHRITLEGGIQLYTDLTLLLGSGFATDPQIPWAGAILTSPDEENVRLDRLFDQTLAYLERVSGPANEHIDEAQRRVRQESTRELPPSAAGAFEEYVLGRLEWIWPQKYADAGPDALRTMVAAAIASAQQHNAATSRGVLTLVGLKYLLGHAVETDPQFLWVADALSGDPAADRRQRAERLFTAAISYLDKWCG